MSTDGWIAPEFEPNRRNRLHPGSKPLAWAGGIFVGLLILSMVGVATRAYFSPSVSGPGSVDVESAATTTVNTVPTEVLGIDSTATSAAPGPFAPPTAGTTTAPRISGPDAGSSSGGGAAPASVPPTSVTPPASTTTTASPPTTTPDDRPVVPVPVASRSETQCPVLSIAKGHLRSTILLVNLRATGVTVDINGNRVDVASDGCQTLTVDAVPVSGVRDVLTVIGADPACTVTLTGSLVDLARSYEMQVRDTGEVCGIEAVPEIRIFEAILWRAPPPSRDAPVVP